LTSADKYEEAQSRGHDLKAVLAAMPAGTANGTGGTESLVSPVALIKVGDQAIVTFNLKASDITNAFPKNGMYLVGLVPQAEIAYTLIELSLNHTQFNHSHSHNNSLTTLVNANSPTWRLVDSAALSIIKLDHYYDQSMVDNKSAAVNTVPGTYERIPTAPGLTNHLTFSVKADAAALGLELTQALPMLGCALLSDESDGSVAARVYYSDITMTLESWSETARPSQLQLKFVFKNSGVILNEGPHCIQLVFNGWLTKTVCSDTSVFVEVFHLPSSLYSYQDSACDVAGEVADYPYFSRNFAKAINVVNREVDLVEPGGAMRCRFDIYPEDPDKKLVYDFLHQLYVLNVESLLGQGSSWSLQDVLQSATTTNTSHLELYEGGSSPVWTDYTDSATSLRVFFRAHLADFWDARAPSQELGDGQPTSGVYHPGERITITGYFLNNSRQGSLLKLTFINQTQDLTSPTIELKGPTACLAKSQFQTSCDLPAAANFTAYGEYLVSFEEVNTGIELSDDHSMLVLLVLPTPIITNVTPVHTVVPSESLAGEGERRLLQLRIGFDWGTILGTQELEQFKHVYMTSTRCRIGTLGAPLTQNITWTNSSQLSCFFDDEVHITNPLHQCVEVSINEGRTFTTDCTQRLNSSRAPLIYDFAPKESLIADNTTIEVTGVGFDSSVRYWC